MGPACLHTGNLIFEMCIFYGVCNNIFCVIVNIVNY